MTSMLQVITFYQPISNIQHDKSYKKHVENMTDWTYDLCVIGQMSVMYNTITWIELSNELVTL